MGRKESNQTNKHSIIFCYQTSGFTPSAFCWCKIVRFKKNHKIAISLYAYDKLFDKQVRKKILW